MNFATQRFSDLNPQCRLPSTFGEYGICPEFDNYGMNSSDFWYEIEQMKIWDFMSGDIHTYIYLDKHGDYLRHEADVSPDAIYPQPLGPSTPPLQGPASLEDLEYLSL